MVRQITAVLNIIYKLSFTANIIIGPSRIQGIKTVVNVFTFALSRSVLYLSRLKQ